jgi:hypothetical protein
MDLRDHPGPLKPQSWLAKRIAVEENDVSREDAVWIPDVLAIHAPDVWPEPGVL